AALQWSPGVNSRVVSHRASPLKMFSITRSPAPVSTRTGWEASPMTLRNLQERSMQITAVETLRLTEFANIIFVRIRTDQGMSGLGETWFGAAATEAYIHETA